MKKILLMGAFLLIISPVMAQNLPALSHTVIPNSINNQLSAVQAGASTLQTDGNGKYWLNRTVFDPNTGAQTAGVIQPINVTAIQAKITALQAQITTLQSFLALVPNATVVAQPAPQ